MIVNLQETYRPNFVKKQRNKCSKKDQSVKTEETFYGNRYLVVPSPQMVVNKSLAKRFTHQNDGAIKTSAVVEATFLGGTKIEYSNEVSIDFMTMITLSDFLVFFRHFEKKQFFQPIKSIMKTLAAVTKASTLSGYINLIVTAIIL